MKLHVKRDDTVIIVSGDDKGAIGKVLEVSPKENGGIVEAEAAFYACKAQLYCDKCKKGTRPAYKMDGDKKVRVCAKCGAEI